MVATKTSHPPQAEFWWPNAIFFIVVHVAAVVGVYFYPIWSIPFSTSLLSVVLWQLACFGITIGYHRLYSHRAFRAKYAVRVVLAALGSMAFQGSIKWWCLRHRLHHRFTDDPVHDPYSATHGLLFSHMGWIFYKPRYERLDQVDGQDLEADPVVRIQHKYYVPLALFLGLVLPPVIGYAWGDPVGAFIWGGLVSRLAIWHCTFIINSFAHWDGLQRFMDENTSRGNMIMAMLTCGEGNHNFHAFPQDFRSGPSILDWDPSKWIIVVLQKFGLVSGLRRARDQEIRGAMVWMHRKHTGDTTSEDDDSADYWTGPEWTKEELVDYVTGKSGRTVVVIDGFAVDVTKYLSEHPGGALQLIKYAVRSDKVEDIRDASWAFHGGLNNHYRGAKMRMRELRVSKLV